jgi:hypothetical protein
VADADNRHAAVRSGLPRQFRTLELAPPDRSGDQMERKFQFV